MYVHTYVSVLYVLQMHLSVQKRNFHAHPIVTGAPIHSKPPPPPTKAEPFNFQTDVRGHKYQEEFERKVLCTYVLSKLGLNDNGKTYVYHYLNMNVIGCF